MDASTLVYDLNGRTLVDAANMALPVGQAVAALDGDLFVGANNLPNSFQQYSQNTLLYNADGTPNVNPQTGKQFTMGSTAQFLNIVPSPPIFGDDAGMNAEEFFKLINSMPSTTGSLPSAPATFLPNVPPIAKVGGGAAIGAVVGGPVGAVVGGVIGWLFSR